MSHNWDLFAPLMCFVANPNLPQKNRIKVTDLHPFRDEKTEIKKFDLKNWGELKSFMKGRKKFKKEGGGEKRQ